MWAGNAHDLLQFLARGKQYNATGLVSRDQATFLPRTDKVVECIWANKGITRHPLPPLTATINHAHERSKADFLTALPCQHQPP